MLSLRIVSLSTSFNLSQQNISILSLHLHIVFRRQYCSLCIRLIGVQDVYIFLLLACAPPAPLEPILPCSPLLLYSPQCFSTIHNYHRSTLTRHKYCSQPNHPDKTMIQPPINRVTFMRLWLFEHHPIVHIHHTMSKHASNRWHDFNVKIRYHRSRIARRRVQKWIHR